MNGPTIGLLPWGRARRASNPSPRSRVRGTMTSSSASQDWGSPSTGSLVGIQLMGAPFFGDYSRNYRASSKHTYVVTACAAAKQGQLASAACAYRNDGGKPSQGR